MATVAEEPKDFNCNIESVCHIETTSFESETCAEKDESRQEMQPEVKQELQNNDESTPESEEDNEEKRSIIKYEICPDISAVCANEIGENFLNGNMREHTADRKANVENGVSEEIQVESESICVVEDSLLKIKKGDNVDMSEVNVECSLVSYSGSIPENENAGNEEQCETVADLMYVAIGENTEFKWEKLFTPAKTKFQYPEDEKDIQKLAAALWETRQILLGRDLHDVITTCNIASQWRFISDECKKYVYQRMSLLYLAVTRGWRFALAASYPDSGYNKRRPAFMNMRGGFRGRKRRRIGLEYNSIQIQQTDQVISTQEKFVQLAKPE